MSPAVTTFPTYVEGPSPMPIRRATLSFILCREESCDVRGVRTSMSKPLVVKRSWQQLVVKRFTRLTSHSGNSGLDPEEKKCVRLGILFFRHLAMSTKASQLFSINKQQ